MDRIPFYKAELGEAEIAEVVDTLRGGWLTTGARTREFERLFSERLGHRHSVALNSCTAALHLALEAIGLKPGEGVLVPTMTFAATAEVVRYFNAIPVLVDCRESDFNIDVADAERRLRKAQARGVKVAAIIPVHYGGQIGDMAGVNRLAAEHGLKVIADAAHCCPAFTRANAEAPWEPVGRSADITCYSFYANKCITTGEGGMACTENEEYADRIRHLSLHGISRDAWRRYTAEGSWYYEITAPGYKYNLTDIAAAIGIHQLARMDELHRRRAGIASLYHEKLRDLDEVILPVAHPDRIHSWHLYVIRLRPDRLGIGRNEVIDELKRAGISTSVHYMPLHMHPYYRETFGYAPEDLPCMARVYSEIISLPLYPGLAEPQVEHVCRTLREIIAANRRR